VTTPYSETRGSRRRSARNNTQGDAGAFSSDRTSYGHTVRCYTCQDAFTWDADIQLYQYVDGEYKPLPPMQGIDERKRRDARLEAWVQCPNPSGDFEEEHYLPAAYGSFGPPLVIGLIGATKTGKSHLLAAMIQQIEKDRLGAVGLTTHPASLEQHRSYLTRYVRPLFLDGRGLPYTDSVSADDPVGFIDAIMVDDGRRTRTVAFFDVSGDDLGQITRSMRFVLAMDALIFVVAPELSIGSERTEEADGAFETVLRRFAEQKDAFTIPIAMAINKCDTIRFDHPVARWLRRPELAAYRAWGDAADSGELIKQIANESRDAYAYLYKHEEAMPWLRPVEEFRQATLHFVSATGGNATVVERPGADPIPVFPRGVRPRRVLDPLAAIFAMTGVLGDAVREVGT
jgi:hypothetical protein